ncbi:MAG: hypothetical protein AB7U82_23615 [Blastocatellales bacterium]
MRQITFALLLAVALPLVGAAQSVAPKATQTTNENGYGYGYIFAAPGGSSNGGGGTLHIGGGGEGVLKNGVGIGAELGYLYPFEGIDEGLGTFSVNGAYHFLKASRSEKVTPFVTAGYTGFFRSGYANGFNFGGGVNYWFKKRVGLRFEFRDNVFAADGAAHLLNVRIGLTFR